MCSELRQANEKAEHWRKEFEKKPVYYGGGSSSGDRCIIF